jgi:ABC-2 type transport system permease protein
MTETTTTVLPSYRMAQRVTQRRVIHAEFTKLRSLPSAAWSLLISVVVITGFGVLYSSLRAARPPQGPAAVAAFDSTSASLAGVEIAMLVTGVLGVLFLTGEYATGQVRSTFTAVPRRLPVLWGKAVVLALAAFTACAVAAVAAFTIGQSILSARHLGTSLGDPGTVRAILGSALFLAVAALLGLGLGALLRSTAGAIGLLFGALFALQVIAGLLPGTWSDQVTRYLPGPAGLDITATVPDPASLAPWTGLGLFCLYTAVVLGLAAWRVRRQEV